MRAHLPLSLVVAASVAACGAPSGPSGQQQQDIEGGSPDSGDNAVVLFWRPDNQELCSGTLITPSIVMTAAHCLAGYTNGPKPIVYTGEGIGANRSVNPNYDPANDVTLTAHAVNTWQTAPGWTQNATCPNTNDLALVLLSDGVWRTYWGGYAHPGYPMPAPGTAVTGIGYGTHGGNVGSKYDGAENVLAVDSDDIQVDWGSGGNGGFAASGDSGGPLAYNSTIIGITMCHNPSDTEEYYQRVDTLAPWIDSMVGQWEQPCYNSCSADYQDCGTDCFCLAAYYACMRNGCGHGEPQIFCRGNL